MADIAYKDGLELWVWDSGELEGFAVYLNGELLDESILIGGKYRIGRPIALADIEVRFGGADGGATKIVDTKAHKTLSFQDEGTQHQYTIKV